MATQIIDSGVSLKIVTNSVPKFVLKANIKTVEVLIGTMIKIDIGKSSLYDIYVDQAQVDSPVSADVNDLRDKIHAMLQPIATPGSGATEANQLLQTAELTNIKNSVIDLGNKVNVTNSNMILEPKLVDETEGNIVYKGFAIPGSATNTAVWAIQRQTSDGRGNFTYHWALGTKNFDKQWDLRREYAYS